MSAGEIASADGAMSVVGTVATVSTDPSTGTFTEFTSAEAETLCADLKRDGCDIRLEHNVVVPKARVQNAWIEDDKV